MTNSEELQTIVRSCLRATGETLITCGVVVFLFMAYMFWGTAAREGGAQRRFASELGRQWASPDLNEALLGATGHLTAGEPFAFVRIPRFGPTWRFAVVQGTGLAQLALGPGHVPGTALPGQDGNFAIAGHRVTAGNPFWSVPSLRQGDLVFIDALAGTYEYRIDDRPVWVSPGDLAMLAPVPGHPGLAPRRPVITLITCDPAWTGTSRVVVTGVLIRTMLRHPREGS